MAVWEWKEVFAGVTVQRPHRFHAIPKAAKLVRTQQPLCSPSPIAGAWRYYDEEI
jgi:hypothetical protein